MSFRMYHPDVDATAMCPDEAAFFQAWEPRGWKKLGEAEAFAGDILGRTITDLDKDLKVDEVKYLIKYRGHELPSSNAKGDQLKVLRSLFTEEPATEVAAPQLDPSPGFIPDANNPARGLLLETPDTTNLPVEPQES